MRVRNTILWAAGIVAALGVGFVSGTAQERHTPRIVAVYGVGGVLSDDGILWQYMPEERQWMTIDEAFLFSTTVRFSGTDALIGGELMPRIAAF